VSVGQILWQLLKQVLVWMILQSLLSDEQIASAPILILGNKIDLPGAASEDEIRHLFGLHSLTTGKVYLYAELDLFVFVSCAIIIIIIIITQFLTRHMSAKV